MLHKLEFHAMGCEMLAVIDSPQPPDALQQVPGWFEHWEQLFSRFRLESELSRVNNRSGLPTQVSPEFAEVLELALSAQRESAGLVTPFLLDALLSAGYDRSFEALAALPDPWGAPAILGQSQGDIDWDASTRMLCLPPGLHLDFGGLVKGWAASRAVERLKAFGPALVDAGGDIAVSGKLSDGASWPVGVAAPFPSVETLAVLKLGAGGVATSGKDRRRWQKNGGWQHHLIDPRTNIPSQSFVQTATVIASSSIQAEWAAKTCLLLGPQDGLTWLNTHPAFSGLLTLEDGQVYTSKNFKNHLWS